MHEHLSFVIRVVLKKDPPLEKHTWFGLSHCRFILVFICVGLHTKHSLTLLHFSSCFVPPIIHGFLSSIFLAGSISPHCSSFISDCFYNVSFSSYLQKLVFYQSCFTIKFWTGVWCLGTLHVLVIAVFDHTFQRISTGLCGYFLSAWRCFLFVWTSLYDAGEVRVAQQV